VNKQVETEVKAAMDDLRGRTLSRMPSPLERLIYIASTRDYNSGRYHHAGLEARFGVVASADALLSAHNGAFAEVASLSLGQLTEELLIYIQKSRERPEVFLGSWQKLEPFRVTIPLHADPILVDLFISNIKLALAVTKYRLRTDRRDPSTALQAPSLGLRSRLQPHS